MLLIMIFCSINLLERMKTKRKFNEQCNKSSSKSDNTSKTTREIMREQRVANWQDPSHLHVTKIRKH